MLGVIVFVLTSLILGAIVSVIAKIDFLSAVLIVALVLGVMTKVSEIFS